MHSITINKRGRLVDCVMPNWRHPVQSGWPWPWRTSLAHLRYLFVCVQLCGFTWSHSAAQVRSRWKEGGLDILCAIMAQRILKAKGKWTLFEPWPTFVIVLVNTTHNIKQIYNSEIVHVMSKVSNSAFTHLECPHPSTRTLVSIHWVGTSIYTGRLWPRR